MSKIKTLLPEEWEGFDTSEPFYYPGELDYEMEQGFKQLDLTKYTDEELEAELKRRKQGPLTNTKLVIDNWQKSLEK
jgi:hypothetical protein